MSKQDVEVLLDEAELARRRKALRKFPQYRPHTDDQLNHLILAKEAGKAAGAQRASVSPWAPTRLNSGNPPIEPEMLLQEAWRPEFKRLVKEHLTRVKDDVDIVLLKPIIENHILNLLMYRVALAGGAGLRDLKELNTAILATATALGLTEARRRAGQKRSEDSIIDAFHLSLGNVEKGKQGRAERIRKAEDRAKEKLVDG